MNGTARMPPPGARGSFALARRFGAPDSSAALLLRTAIWGRGGGGDDWEGWCLIDRMDASPMIGVHLFVFAKMCSFTVLIGFGGSKMFKTIVGLTRESIHWFA